MSEAFLGEIRLVAFDYAPKFWAQCNGQLLPINQNQALFSLLGTTYGGNGQTSFALPDLRGRAPMHFKGTELYQGSREGAESVTLTQAQLPAHSHALAASGDIANASVPGGALPAARPRGGINRYAPTADVSLASGSIAPTGGSQPHTNMQPFLTMNYVIALSGIFPSRN
jgi:microcystin-dependent protein